MRHEDSRKPRPVPGWPAGQGRARLEAGTAVLLLTAVAVRHDRVGPGETAVFRVINDLPGSLYRPARAIMQLGAPAAVPATARFTTG